MKPVAHTYTNKQKCSIQECVYHFFSGQWLRKTFPGIVFANNNLPKKDTEYASVKRKFQSYWKS